ncbi:NUDIX domain-containing protein [Planctomonas sp. JC2975]|uniref:NUDIX domain-containing protein n=1 Tax=Planctomonas sp. JC2975 TaxID=2729626 RepID=UPI001473F61A|nr:NUDIX domain-containing protein [Planctomonas sp. JC2975]NNC14039.1 NUDIX domain-containing protein [Planctomonas sp. JC2975]
MPMSPYVRSLRNRIGHDLLLLPGVTAVIRNGDRFLLARQRDTGRWSLIGGGVEPGETPQEAVVREVHEEIGVRPVVRRIVGAYGGKPLVSTYPNGDQIAAVTVAFECVLPSNDFTLEAAELIETGWLTREQVNHAERHEWIDNVLDDAAR